MRLVVAIATAILSLAFTQAGAAALSPDKPTVLITGANRGIGLEFVRQFAICDFNVIATTRDVGKAAELQELAKKDPRIVVETLDVTDHAGIDALAAKYKDQPIDILVSNAAITPRLQTAFTGKSAKLDYDVARRSFDTNALGAIKVASTFLPSVAASKHKKIVFISSKAGSFAESPKMPMMFEYRASKAALNMLVYAFSFESKAKGVTAFALSPGTVSTEPAPGEFGYGMNIRQPNSIPPADSVTAMLKVINDATAEQNGLFLDYKDGRVIPW